MREALNVPYVKHYNDKGEVINPIGSGYFLNSITGRNAGSVNHVSLGMGGTIHYP